MIFLRFSTENFSKSLHHGCSFQVQRLKSTKMLLFTATSISNMRIEQERSGIKRGVLCLRHLLQSHHHPHHGCTGQLPPHNHHTRPYCMIVIIILCQTLTDPTVKHECSPDVTEDPDYWVTYRFACFFSINIHHHQQSSPS